MKILCCLLREEITLIVNKVDLSIDTAAVIKETASHTAHKSELLSKSGKKVFEWKS